MDYIIFYIINCEICEIMFRTHNQHPLLPLLSEYLLRNRLYLLRSQTLIRRLTHFPGSRWDMFHTLIISRLGAVCGLSIITFLHFLLLGRAINPVPLTSFQVRVVCKTLGTSRISEISDAFSQASQGQDLPLENRMLEA
jgi:hypothetical protein